MRRPPPWKRLVDQLTDEGYESPYLDRLRQRLDVYQAQEDLEKEILQEMASALGRAEEKVLVALLELEVIGRELDRLEAQQGRDSAWAERVNQRVDAFNRQRKRVLHYLWELVIHREAIGLTRHRILEECYPVPPPRRGGVPER